MEESASLLRENRECGHLLNGVFGVVDAARLLCADYTEAMIQNSYYQCCTCSVEITDLFVFNFKGEIIFAALNFPGS